MKSNLKFMAAVRVASSTLLVVAVLSGQHCAAQSVPPTFTSPSKSFSVVIAPTEHEFKTGSPVNIEVTLTNNSDRTLQLFHEYVINPAGSGPLYNISVVDGQGNVPPDTKLGRLVRYWVESSPNVGRSSLMGGQGLTDEVKPGNSFTRVLDLGLFYDLSCIGKYTVRVREFPAGYSEPKTSNSTEVRIVASTTKPPVGTVPTSPAISLSITRLPEQTKVAYGLRADMVTKNTSDHPIVIRMEEASKDQVGSIYKVSMHDEKGESLAETPYGLESGNANDAVPAVKVPHPAGTYLRLLPGESWADTILLNKVLNLSRSGQYTIQVRRWDGQTRTWAVSDSVKTSVTR